VGLESVELVLSMEDAFEISISDDEAQRVFTPKDAIELISKKVQLNNDNLCLNQVAFYRLRQLLVNQFDIPRKEISPDKDLSIMLPPEKQKEFWSQLGEIMGIKNTPQLSRPTWVVWVAFLFSLGFGIYLLSVLSLGLGFLGGLILFAVTMISTIPLKKRIPPYYAKIEKIVRYWVVENPKGLKKTKSWSPSQIRHEVKNIVMEVLGTDKYKEHWEFVRDFGIG